MKEIHLLGTPHVSLWAHAGLVALSDGEAAHIRISDGRDLDFKLYSTFPGSEKRKKQKRILVKKSQ